jgi:hypothetical protein
VIKTLNIKFYKAFVFKIHKLKRILTSKEGNFSAFLLLKLIEDREQEGRIGPVWGVGTSEGGRMWGKGIGG